MIWAVATILTGFVHGLATPRHRPRSAGFGEGATFPTATRAMQNWTPARKRGFAQGLTHRLRAAGKRHHPALIAALMALLTWRGSFMALGVVSIIWVLAWVLYFHNDPKDHPSITADELERLPARVTTGAREDAVDGAMRASLAG